jgi:hypothetical protein
MPENAEYKLKVSLGLVWLRNNIYGAKVSVTILDTCYVAGDLKIGLPPGTVGVPEVEYLTFSFTHKDGPCGQIVQTVDKSIEVPFSTAKPKVTAFAVVNGKVAGQDTKPFPK